jgi:3-oxoacyl-[acyl-carrier protein] reductase
MDLGLDGRAYVVTGGSGGLGLATAEALVADGARVVVTGRTQESVAAAVDALGGDHATGVTADNGDPQTPGRLVEAARAAYGRLDGALISVGGPQGGGVLDTAEADWSAAFDSILLGGLRLGREIGRELAGQPDGGSIAFVLSTSVKSPIPGLSISNGLRPGLAMVAKDLADALGPQGVRVNGLMPGRVDTERVRWLDDQSGDAAAARERTSAAIALRRYGRPEEFGRAAAFLLSPAAGFISGVMLPVDGGMLRAL